MHTPALLQGATIAQPLHCLVQQLRHNTTPLQPHAVSCSGKQRPPLRHTDVDAVHVPLLRVSSRPSAAAEHDLPALHAASRRPAVQGMRQQLGDECRVRASHRKSRVGFKPGDERVLRMLPPPALVIAKSTVIGRRLRHCAVVQRATRSQAFLKNMRNNDNCAKRKGVETMV